ncbi:MAG TPA: hypothetical protein VFV51_01785 [Vicinamibacterales bacterium]|nr:hypothetical protein [Vicinamibacterales bacterium]
MVIVQFVADTLFKTLVVVPVLGGLVLVALVAGGNPFEMIRFDDLTQTISAMVGVLLAHPVALAAFLVALGVILAGGSVLMFAVKAGTVTVLLAGDRAAGPIEEPPLRLSALRQANQATLERFVDGVKRLFPRYLRLGLLLTTVYGLIAGAYLAFLFGPPISPALDGPMITTLASLAVIVTITLANFLYLLMQIMIAAEDCSVSEAVPHVVRLIRKRTRELAQVLAAILSLMLMATAASILATTALGLIAFVPFVGLAALPLQILAWLVRGVVFQFVGLTGVSTYLRLHYALQPSGVRVPDGLLSRT